MAVTDATSLRKDSDDFSVVLGGPLYQMVRRAHLSGDALELMRRRILFFALVTWLPMLLQSVLGGRAWGDAVRVQDFKVEIVIVVVFLLIIVLGPLLLFLPHLAAARRIGLREYGTLAQRYVREFDDKWLRGRAPAGKPLIGSADIQSLADLGNSYEIVREMRTVPFTKDTVLLTMVSLEELLKKLLQILL